MSLQPPDWSVIDTCVLDMDGTLLDLYFDDLVWNEHLPRYVARRKQLSLAAAKQEVAATLTEQHGSLNWYCFQHWSRVFGFDLGDIELELKAFIQVRPGTLDFLKSLRRRNIRLILATNAHPDSLARKIAVTGIDQYFDFVISAHQFGAPKEHHQFWTQLDVHCEINPAHTVFVDDNHAVLDAARKFGLTQVFGVALPNSRGDLKHHPEYQCIQSFAELLNDGALA